MPKRTLSGRQLNELSCALVDSDRDIEPYDRRRKAIVIPEPFVNFCLSNEAEKLAPATGYVAIR